MLVGGADGGRDLGGLPGVFAVEARAAHDAAGSAVEVGRIARERPVRSGTGREAVAGVRSELREIMAGARRRPQRQRRIASVAAFEPLPPDATLGDPMTGRLSTGEERRRALTAMHETLRATARDRGDERLRDSGDEVAGWFLTQVPVLAREPGATREGATARECVLRGLARLGFDPAGLPLDTPVTEVMRLAHFTNRLRIVHPATGMPWASLRRRAAPGRVPCEVVREALEASAPSDQRRSGGDANDATLAALATYADVVFVDKRTAERCRRARAASPVAAALLGGVRKSVSWAQVPRALPSS